MTDYSLTDRAEADLFDLTVYGYGQFGIRQTEAYAASLEHVFQLLAENPHLGRKADSIRHNVRRHDHNSHVVLYETTPNGVLILAIVHGSSMKRLAL